MTPPGLPLGWPQLTAQVLVPVLPLEGRDGAEAKNRLKRVNIYTTWNYISPLLKPTLGNVEGDIANECTLSKTGVSLALSSQRRQRSSAYANKFNAVFPIVYPLFSDSTPPRIPSMTKVKRIGLSGQPYFPLTPFPRAVGLLVVLPTWR